MVYGSINIPLVFDERCVLYVPHTVIALPERVHIDKQIKHAIITVRWSVLPKSGLQDWV